MTGKELATLRSASVQNTPRSVTLVQHDSVLRDSDSDKRERQRNLQTAVYITEKGRSRPSQYKQAETVKHW